MFAIGLSNNTFLIVKEGLCDFFIPCCVFRPRAYKLDFFLTQNRQFILHGLMRNQNRGWGCGEKLKYGGPPPCRHLNGIALRASLKSWKGKIIKNSGRHEGSTIFNFRLMKAKINLHPPTAYKKCGKKKGFLETQYNIGRRKSCAYNLRIAGVRAQAVNG